MTRIHSLITVVISALLFSFLGGIVGFALGKFIPGYYQGVFSNGDDPSFNSVEVGLGLGISQGLMGGALIGVLLVFVQEPSIRQRAGEILRKCRKAIGIIALALLVLSIWIGVTINSMSNSLHLQRYITYVSSEYIPTVKAKTGQWPKSLRLLPQHIKALEEYDRTDRYYNDLLKVHRESLDRFKPVRSDGQNYIYVLHLDGWKAECESSQEDGDCTLTAE